jgi:hypothetical protein
MAGQLSRPAALLQRLDYLASCKVIFLCIQEQTVDNEAEADMIAGRSLLPSTCRSMLANSMLAALRSCSASIVPVCVDVDRCTRRGAAKHDMH